MWPACLWRIERGEATKTKTVRGSLLGRGEAFGGREERQLKEWSWALKAALQPRLRRHLQSNVAVTRQRLRNSETPLIAECKLTPHTVESMHASVCDITGAVAMTRLQH